MYIPSFRNPVQTVLHGQNMAGLIAIRWFGHWIRLGWNWGAKISIYIGLRKVLFLFTLTFFTVKPWLFLLHWWFIRFFYFCLIHGISPSLQICSARIVISSWLLQHNHSMIKWKIKTVVYYTKFCCTKSKLEFISLSKYFLMFDVGAQLSIRSSETKLTTQDMLISPSLELILVNKGMPCSYRIIESLRYTHSNNDQMLPDGARKVFKATQQINSGCNCWTVMPTKNID